MPMKQQKGYSTLLIDLPSEATWATTARLSLNFGCWSLFDTLCLDIMMLAEAIPDLPGAKQPHSRRQLHISLTECGNWEVSSLHVNTEDTCSVIQSKINLIVTACQINPMMPCSTNHWDSKWPWSNIKGIFQVKKKKGLSCSRLHLFD